MIRSIDFYGKYMPLFLPTVGGVVIVLMLIMLLMLSTLNKRVSRLEEKVTKLITD
jgi:hypothetical protein